ncbi:MAG: Fic family protein [Synergistaceae bacterium]|nr:Fic family protein [Candidatus Equadaptatus faecalis]
MNSFREQASKFESAEKMAQAFLKAYFGNSKIVFPLNPFQMLKDEGIIFSISNFHKLEGVYVPAADGDDVPVVGINANRPITRQRYTAVHELCHHFRDTGKSVVCPMSPQSATEKFAESFASAVLMPYADLKHQVNKRKNAGGYISFDDVLEIADYFGVSFQACLFRIAYVIHAISVNTEPSELRKSIAKYAPEKKRRAKHLSYAKLYAGLFDCYFKQLATDGNDRARFVFQNNYIYNDSRIEGLDVDIEQISEIVTDLRLKKQNSCYCSDTGSDAYMSAAGHYDIYQHIFTEEHKDKLSVFETMSLNQKLFAYYPHPEFGGSTRKNNTLVIGAKFETVDHNDIANELAALDTEVKRSFEQRFSKPLSKYIQEICRIHHRLTVIHPFADGNGRTARAFMNMQLVRSSITPLYIRTEDKDEYIEALAAADKTQNYEPLYEVIFKAILRSHVELKML